VPALLRVNIGSSGTGLSDAVVYGIKVERVDLSIVAGVGFEISRFIIEDRGTWSFLNIAKETNAREVKSTTFAILSGIRFN